MFAIYTQFRNLFSDRVCLYTLALLFHLLRKSVFDTERGRGDLTGDGGGELYMILCVGINLWIILANATVWKRVQKTNLGLYVYYVFCIFSIGWSTSGNFLVPLSKAFEIISSIGVVTIILYRIGNLQKIILYILYITTIATFFGFIQAFREGIYHTNVYSISAMIGILISVGTWNKMRYDGKYIFLIANIFFLGIGTSLASYMSLLCGLAILFSFSKGKFSILRMCLIVFVVYILYKMAFPIVSEYVLGTRTEEEINSGTGRAFIWEYMIDAWKERPWFGYGYIVGERSLFLFSKEAWQVQSAHNGFLSVLINTGIIGEILFGFYYIKTVVSAYTSSKRMKKTPYPSILCACLVACTVNNLSFPLIGSDWSYVFPPTIALFTLANMIPYSKVNSY